MIPFPNISPVAFTIGGFHVHWYGIAYVLSIYLGLKHAQYLAIKYNPSLSSSGMAKGVSIEDASSYIVLGILLGGRLGYILFYDLAYYLTFP